MKRQQGFWFRGLGSFVQQKSSPVQFNLRGLACPERVNPCAQTVLGVVKVAVGHAAVHQQARIPAARYHHTILHQLTKVGECEHVVGDVAIRKQRIRHFIEAPRRSIEAEQFVRLQMESESFG